MKKNKFIEFIEANRIVTGRRGGQETMRRRSGIVGNIPHVPEVLSIFIQRIAI